MLDHTVLSEPKESLDRLEILMIDKGIFRSPASVFKLLLQHELHRRFRVHATEYICTSMLFIDIDPIFMSCQFYESIKLLQQWNLRH